METNFLINQIGDWNPQFLREVKGRLNKRNVLLVCATSLLLQFGVFVYFQGLLPNANHATSIVSNRYCTGKYLDINYECFLDAFGNVITNWPLWFQETFACLSLIGFFTVIVAGTYLLIHDLATEERRDTLNFIRLSPQSPSSILLGKMLGVPILVYLGLCLAIPMHLWLGLNGKAPLYMILGFYGIFITTSFLYFSGALLFGLIGVWLGGFQAWLGGGAVFGFLLITKQVLSVSTSYNYPLLILNLVNPYYFIPHALEYVSNNDSISANFYWFVLPIGNSWMITIGFAMLIHCLCAYFIWQSLQRCFRDRNTTMLSKQQSYLVTLAFTIITIGCANWSELVFSTAGSNYSYAVRENISCLIFLNFWFFLYLIAALSPQRHTIQDWARYRHLAMQQGSKNSLMAELIWGEKSPGIVAITINVVIAISALILFNIVSISNLNDQLNALLAFTFAGSLVVIYAALTQLLLLMKNSQRLFWTNGILGAVIILPVIACAIFFSYPGNNSLFWMFSVAAPLIALYSSTNISAATTCFAIIGHMVILSLLLIAMTRQFQQLGKSNTKVLLTGS